MAVINVNFLIRIPTITRDVSRNDESNERGGKIGTTLNEKRKKKQVGINDKGLEKLMDESVKSECFLLFFFF